MFDIHNQQCFSTFEGKNEFRGNKLNLTMDSFDRVIVSDNRNNQIELFDEEWKSICTFGSNRNELGQFNDPEGIYIDEKKGKLIVCDSYNNRIEIMKEKEKK